MTAAGSLAGKAVVVTGAGRGLGAEYATHAAGEGAAVVVNDIDATLAEQVTEAIHRAGGTAIAHPADVASWTDSAHLIERCVSGFGTIDGLVNNAGIARYARPEEQDERSFREVIETNLLGTAFCGVHAIRMMAQRSGGAIVNVVSGAQMGMEGAGAYGASKGAVAALTYSWALETSRTGVRVNAVSPLAHTLMESLYSEFVGREAFPEPVDGPGAVAPLVSYLLSDRAAPINGRTFRMNGDDINLVRPPAIVRPGQTARHWSVDALHKALARLLAGQPTSAGVTEQVTSEGRA